MTIARVEGVPPTQRYPMLPAGGAFLVCVGLGLIGGIAFSGAAPVNFKVFLPMAISFGPRFAVLGLACILNAALGLLAASIPYEVFGLVDGALKLGFGAWSLASSFR
ncbi:MAG TPA: DUF6609 family protein [Gammaproteobacteria bacterium]|nr:DUF6609 family protein [Gammaproteobacteria bacterium]